MNKCSQYDECSSTDILCKDDTAHCLKSYIKRGLAIDIREYCEKMNCNIPDDNLKMYCKEI
jgi:hypothetical protein